MLSRVEADFDLSVVLQARGEHSSRENGRNGERASHHPTAKATMEESNLKQQHPETDKPALLFDARRCVTSTMTDQAAGKRRSNGQKRLPAMPVSG
jgi:hypothetical protein